MARCSRARLAAEWRRSIDVLTDVVGEPIVVASVPGGELSRRVIEAAAEAGIEYLFSSTPTIRARRVYGCWVIGRFAVQRFTDAQTAAALVAGDRIPRFRHRVTWRAKQLCKALGGPLFLRARARMLGGSPDVTWGDEVPLA
jgi:hypothetical protein